MKYKDRKYVFFVCYPYRDGSGHEFVMYLFYPDGVWDDDKLTEKEALDNYPMSEYNWIQESELEEERW